MSRFVRLEIHDLTSEGDATKADTFQVDNYTIHDKGAYTHLPQCGHILEKKTIEFIVIYAHCALHRVMAVISCSN